MLLDSNRAVLLENGRSQGYRPDIDGLRAIAVILVFFFHLDFSLFRGGFIGVDVFFVISGFLITRILVRDISNHKFSLIEFFLRRARRIFPALFSVLLVSATLAWFLLTPIELEGFAKSFLSVLGFVSNLYFWNSADYFNPPLESLPLLHTWSLSIEEQFYVLYPVGLLLFLKRIRRVDLRVLFSVIGLISFVINLVLTAKNPIHSFYLLPARMWELLIGGWLAVQINHWPDKSISKKRRELVAALGLACILGAAIGYSDKTAFPGLAALLPCVGACLLIYAGSSAGSTVVTRVLSFKVLVGIGLVSYSLYLIHWPAIFYLKIMLARNLTMLESLLLFLTCLGFSTGSYFLIEKPARESLMMSRRMVGGASALFVLISAVFCISVLVDKGVPQRFSQRAIRLANESYFSDPERDLCHSIDPQEILQENLCHFGPEEDDPVVMVWGDSHARAIMPAIKHLADVHGTKTWFASYTGCPPLLGVKVNIAPIEGCEDFNEAMLKLIEKRNIKKVILISNWQGYYFEKQKGIFQNEQKRWSNENLLDTVDQKNNNLDQTSKGDFLRFTNGLDRTLSKIDSFGAKVWILGQVPQAPFNVPKSLARSVILDRSIDDMSISFVSHQTNTAKLRQNFKDFSKKRNLSILEPSSMLCDGAKKCRIHDGENVLYVDDDHLSSVGSMELLPLFRPVFREAI